MAPCSSNAFGRVVPLEGALAVFLAFCSSPEDWDGVMSHDVIRSRLVARDPKFIRQRSRGAGHELCVSIVGRVAIAFYSAVVAQGKVS